MGMKEIYGGRKAKEVAKGQGNGWGIKFARFASRLLASTYSLCPSSVVSSFSQSLIKVQLQVKLKHDNVAVREGERERGDLPAVAYPFLLFFLRWPNLSSCVPIVPHHLRASRRSLAAELLNTRLSGAYRFSRVPLCFSRVNKLRLRKKLIAQYSWML